MMIECHKGTHLDFDAKATNTGDTLFEVGLIHDGAPVTTICANTLATKHSLCSDDYIDKQGFYKAAKEKC